MEDGIICTLTRDPAGSTRASKGVASQTGTESCMAAEDVTYVVKRRTGVMKRRGKYPD